MKERMRFIQDEDGHWYLILADQREVFDSLLRTCGRYWGIGKAAIDEFNKLFGDCRLGMSITNYTFTDVEEEVVNNRIRWGKSDLEYILYVLRIIDKYD